MYELIEHKVLDADASSITFNNVPQTYKDLYLAVSDRSNRAATNDALILKLNGATSTGKRLYGSGSSVTTTNNPDPLNAANTDETGIFSNIKFHISNYASTTSYKAWSADGVDESNATSAYQSITSGIYSSNTAVTSITLEVETGTGFKQYSSATLYGVGRRAGIGRAPLAVGGYTKYDNGYWIHTFPSSGSFTPFVDMDVEYLVVAGGGGGGWDRAGGGGAGGYRSSVQNELSGRASSPEALLSLSASTNYSVIIGAGGTGGSSGQSQGSNGADSTFATITSTGGGGGSSYTTGANGGSGGGGFGQPFTNNTDGEPGIAGQGFNGGNGVGASPYHAGGGGGAGSPGIAATSSGGGDGGDGLPSSITGAIIYRAGGGGGSPDFASSSSVGAGGLGGGGVAGKPPGVGAVNTGSGGGGGGNFPQTNGATGGSGVVIVRYKA